MVGYKTEDVAYAIEVTYNYGVDSYKTGTGLASISLAVDDLQTAAQTASKMGYMARSNGKGQVLVLGPDNYRYALVSKAAEEPREEPFLAVRLHVSDVAAASAFYTTVLRMTSFETLSTRTAADAMVEPGDAVLGYSPDQVALVLHQSVQAPRIEQYEGRHAISMPADTLKAVYAQIERDSPKLIVHEIMELHETLGTLFIAIIKDVDGFEICLVSSETFDKAVLAAADFKGPDWDLRKKLIAERSAAAAERKKKASEASLIGVLGGEPGTSYTPPPQGAGLKDHALAVLKHTLKMLRQDTVGKEEGNFLAVGFVSGALVVGTLSAQAFIARRLAK